MFSKLVQNAREKPMIIALLITLGRWIPRLIDRYDGTFAFWMSAIFRIALATLVTYAAYVVINKALKFAGSLLKRITREQGAQ